MKEREELEREFQNLVGTVIGIERMTDDDIRRRITHLREMAARPLSAGYAAHRAALKAKRTDIE